jgi:hypothetical protein
MRRPRPWRRRPAERQNARRWGRYLWMFCLPRMVQAELQREFDRVWESMVFRETERLAIETDRMIMGDPSGKRPRGIIACHPAKEPAR